MFILSVFITDMDLHIYVGYYGLIEATGVYCGFCCNYLGQGDRVMSIGFLAGLHKKLDADLAEICREGYTWTNLEMSRFHW